MLNGHYNDNVGALTENEGKYYYHYRKDDGLLENQRYTFKGWKSEKDYDNNTTPQFPVNLQELNITKSLKLYAYYDIEDVYANSSDINLFEVNFV